MFNPMTPSLIKAYQDRLLEEAKKGRIPKATRTAKPQLQERLLARVGDLLISAGLRLQERYKPAMCPRPEASQSSC